MEPSQIKKLEQLGFDQWCVIGNKLGGVVNVVGLLTSDLEVEVREAVKLLFDKHGRRIPKGLRADVCDANRDFYLKQPQMAQEVDFANRISRLEECLGVDIPITAEQLKQEAKRLLTLIQENSQIANITNGVWLPVILPKLITDDIGTELEYYLTAVGKSYAKTFSDRKFYNYREGDLADKVSIIDGSRHNQLIEQMKQCPVLGIHFPNPCQGFSVNASREQMAMLPEGFILSGLDTVIAMITYSDILARDFHTPGLDLAALSWRSLGYSLYFGPDGGRLDFDCRGSLGVAYGVCSSGLLFLREC